ncbi:hypothetical protein BDV97DRAFT_23710 [Delphinella strobiligena]|nr:hypothetical protein BDV97DRAFT_23710 [Delphinella strobiligena]
MSTSPFPQLSTTAVTATTSTAIMIARWPISLAMISIFLYAIGGCLLGMPCSSSYHYCNDVIWVGGLVLLLLAAIATIAWLVLLVLFLTNLIERPKAMIRKEPTNIATPVLQVPVVDYPTVPASGLYSQSPILQQTCYQAANIKSGAGDHVVEILPPAPYQSRGDLGSICGMCGILVQTPFCSSCGTQIIDV